MTLLLWSLVSFFLQGQLQFYDGHYCRHVVRLFVSVAAEDGFELEVLETRDGKAKVSYKGYEAEENWIDADQIRDMETEDEDDVGGKADEMPEVTLTPSCITDTGWGICSNLSQICHLSKFEVSDWQFYSLRYINKKPICCDLPGRAGDESMQHRRACTINF